VFCCLEAPSFREGRMSLFGHKLIKDTSNTINKDLEEIESTHLKEIIKERLIGEE